MKFAYDTIFSKDPSNFGGLLIVRIFTLAFLAVTVVLNCLHLFLANAGAGTIASINLSVYGGDSAIAGMHPWGEIQFVLVLLQLAIFFRYPGFTSLILASLLAEPILRLVFGLIVPITSASNASGDALNWPAYSFVLVLFLASLLRAPAED